MKLYRCMACLGGRGTPGRDFEADGPVCPECGAEGNDVLQRVVVHFDPPSGRRQGGRSWGKGHLACRPDVPVLSAGPDGVRYVASGHPDAVTCSACRDSEAFKEAAASFGFDPRYDEPQAPAESSTAVRAGGPKFDPTT